MAGSPNWPCPTRLVIFSLLLNFAGTRDASARGVSVRLSNSTYFEGGSTWGPAERPQARSAAVPTTKLVSVPACAMRALDQAAISLPSGPH